MRRITDILFRLRALLTWGRMQRDLDDEVTFHLEMETAKLVRQGMNEAAARRHALRAFGGIDATKEHVRDAWGVSLVQDLEADVRYAFRQLRKNPLFSVVAALTLALGIGGTTAIFSVVHSVLLEPLPYHDPDRLVAVRHSMPGIGADDVPLSPATYFTYREASRAFTDIGLYKPASVTITELAEPERVDVTLVTDGLFPLLGVGPAMGRGYSREDVSIGTTFPAILSYGLWQRAFGGASDVRRLMTREIEKVLSSSLNPDTR